MAVETEKFAKTPDYNIRFSTDDVRSMGITILIGMQRRLLAAVWAPRQSENSAGFGDATMLRIVRWAHRDDERSAAASLPRFSKTLH